MRAPRRARRRARRRLVLPLALASLGLARPAGGSPAQDYVLHCRGCHGAEGTGAPGRIPSLVELPGRLLTVPGGRAYLVRVPGVAQSMLDDAALAALLEWMLARFSGAAVPDEHAPYTAREVGRLRARPLLDVDAERARLLRALEAGPAQGATGPGR